MAPSFDATTPILNFDQDPFPLSIGIASRILWPALGYRVLAHLPKMRALDVFQRYVLRLCDCGLTAPNAIADKLRLQRDLIEHILTQLQQVGWLDGQRRLTAQGHGALLDDATGAVDPVAGWVFRDPFDGQFWPRFVADEDMRPIAGQIEMHASRAVEVVLKKDQSPMKVHFPAPPPMPVSAPTERELTAVVKRFIVQRRDFERLRANEEPTDDMPDAVRVTILEPTATPYFLMTQVFYPLDETQSDSWLVCDPFNLGVDDRMRGLLLDGAPAGPMKRTLDRLRERANAPDGNNRHSEKREEYAHAAEMVQAVMNGLADDVPEAFTMLVQAAILAQKCHEDEARSGALNSGTARGRRRRFLWKLYAALETLASRTVATFQLAELAGTFSRSTQDTLPRLVSYARSLGFNVPEESKGPRSLDDPRAVLTTHGGMMGAIFVHDKSDLPAALALLIVEARREGQTPFAAAAAEKPDMLSFLAELRQRRDEAAHAVKSRLKDRPPLELFTEALEVCRFLAPRRYGRRSHVSEATTVRSSNARDVLRLRRNAVENIEARLGRAIRRYPSALEHLVDATLVLHDLDDHGAGGPADVINHASNALEDMWRRLLADLPAIPDRSRVTQDRQSLSRELVDVATRLGFELPGNEAELSALTRSKPSRVLDVIRWRKGVMGACVAVCLLAADGQPPEHPIRRLAERDPAFLLRTAAVISARGHGDSVHLSKPEVERVLEAALAATSTVLSVCENPAFAAV